MARNSLDSATVHAYMESLPESEVAAIYTAVAQMVKRRWEFWLGVLLLVLWVAGWIWIASSVGPMVGSAAGIAAFLIASKWLSPPYVGWLTERILKDEVHSRIAPNGV